MIPSPQSSPLADAGARLAIERDLDVNLIVEAAAGTGKTTALTRRIVALLRSGRAKLASIVCVTFTEKAAGEMKLRLRSALEDARRDSEGAERQRFADALAELELSLLGTIHGFCAELLRQRPVEAAIDPRFVVLDDGQATRLYDEVFTDWFEGQLQAPGPGVARVLRRKARDFSGRSSPRDILFDAGRRIVEERNMTGAWERPTFPRKTLLDSLFSRTEKLAELAEVAAHPDDVLAKGIQHVASVVGEIARREAQEGADRDYDALEEAFRASFRGWSGKLWTYRGFKPVFGGGYRKDDVLKLRDPLRDEWQKALVLADAELASLLREDLRSLAERYAERLERRGALDFSGLLLRARDLLAGDADLRAEMRDKYTHVLVDEFQDTDPVQVEILRSLTCAEGETLPLPGRLFLVGDPKQSIYRFRGADVRLYESIKKELTAGPTPGARLVHLTTNFRSVASILELCNATFSIAMASQGELQPTYVAMTPFGEDFADQPSIVALPVPRPYSDKSGKISNWAVDQSYPDAVGAYVDWLVRKSGWTVRGGDGARVPVAARHICLLFRRFSSFGEDLTRPYVRALESRKLPHVLVGGRSFYTREEILATIAALSAIERPDDELAVYATLRGPFFALTDEALLTYRTHVGKDKGGARLFPLAPVPADVPPNAFPVAGALAVLKDLHYARNRWPIARTLTEFYALTRAQAGVAMWPAGEQALSNMLRLVDVARREDALGTVGFRAFVERLGQESASAGASEAPAVEEGSDGVRLMTVHKAKGLEFPVVILVDPTSPMRPERPSRWVDAERKVSLQSLAGCVPLELHEHATEVLAEDEAENARLAYVAATRARDLLVVPALGDEELEGWTQVLRPGIYPDRSRRHDSEARPYHPPFGNDATLERPSRCNVDPYDSVKPGELVPRVGAHKVAFWDPRALELGIEEEAGVRQQRILAADATSGRAEDSKERYDAWRVAHEAKLATGREPSPRVVPVTTAAREHASTDDIEIVKLDRERRSSGGKRFGSLVHALFAAVAPSAGRDVVHAAANVFARALGATADETSDAADVVHAAWAHPLLARGKAAAIFRHEWPIELTSPRQHRARRARCGVLRGERRLDRRRLQDRSAASQGSRRVPCAARALRRSRTPRHRPGGARRASLRVTHAGFGSAGSTAVSSLAPLLSRSRISMRSS